MKTLFTTAKKKSKIVIGLMSGTSLDGIDTVLCKIKNSGIDTKFEIIDFKTYNFPKGLKEKLLENSTFNSGSVNDICMLNSLLGNIYAKAVISICKKNSLPLKKVDLIGSHGQTVHHLPKKSNHFGYTIASTLQIGDPAIIAKLTGILTVGDFRTGDIALGGQGAPLVPYFDYLLFSNKKANRALLNIGGISNITVLPKSNSNKIIAFDTGPGNMLIDLITKKYFSKNYDKDGLIASKSLINDNLLNEIIKFDKFISTKPPKSTGREYYNNEFLNHFTNKFPNLSPGELIATFSDYTAYAVFKNYELYIKDKLKISELFVSGGGANNKFILKSLQKYFGKKIIIHKFEKLGLSSDLKEALCFAVFANETISGNPVNLPNVTGASKRTILGKICLP